MSDPSVILETPVYHVNLTVLLTIVTICLTAFGTFVTIFRKKKNPEAQAGTSPYCLQKQADLERIEKDAKENSEKLERVKEENNQKIDTLRQSVNDNSKEVGILKTQSDNITKGLDEMRQDVKEVASKLDDLLKQLLDWMNY
jgi:septal ring factor EnvC (AmiA/AmiB activator)